MLDCSFSKPAKERIARMQAVGMSDEQIIQAFVRDYGRGRLSGAAERIRLDRALRGRGLGLVVIWLFLRKYRKPVAGGPRSARLEIDDPALAKYKDQIEKDLAKLE